MRDLAARTGALADWHDHCRPSANLDGGISDKPKPVDVGPRWLQRAVAATP